MLDEKTIEWLEDRAENLEIFGGYFCPNCPEFVLEEGIMYCGRGGEEHCVDNPHKYVFKDSAEFEAKVAAKMTRVTVGDLPCGVDADNNECQKPHFMKYNNDERAIGCDMCFLMVARLAVEAEEEE